MKSSGAVSGPVCRPSMIQKAYHAGLAWLAASEELDRDVHQPTARPTTRSRRSGPISQGGC